jgi:serine/threonine-protein kinase RsbW
MGAEKRVEPTDARESVGLTIGSRLENLSMVHALIQSIARQHEMDEEMENALIIAVIEAGTNAIQHGNAFADDKSVSFLFTVSPGEITIRVDDSGNGFDPDRVSDPTDSEHILSPHGRGIYLMRSLMDDVRFGRRSGNGTTVTLRKKRLAPAR